MILAMIDEENDCSFAVMFANETTKEKVEEYMREGLDAWHCAADVPVDYEGKYWTNEDVECFFDLGYAEPTAELLDRFGIEHEIVDIEYDEDGNVSNADEVIYY